jgi:hypothetical protein
VKSASVTKYSVAGTDKADYVGLATAADTLSITKLDGKTFEIADITTAISSALTIGGSAKLKGKITTTAANFALTTENLAKLVEGSEITYSDAVTGTAVALVIPAGVKVDASTAASTFATFTAITVKGNLEVNGFAPTGVVTVDGEGILFLTTDAKLVEAVNILNDGGLALAATKKITLGHAEAKIVGGTAYEIVPGGTTAETDGTLTAGVTDTAVVFTAAGISGYDTSTTPIPIVDNGSASTTATLAFGTAAGTAGPTLTVKDATGIGGVILDVSAKGTIKVDAAKVLTLKLGAGTDAVGSGGIFTKTGAKGGAKANGVNSTELTSNNLAGLAAAKVAASPSVTAVGGATPADGTITGANTTGTTIDTADEFAVGADNAVTIDPKT